ncbi:hypothetical protein BDR22DRAFT_65487 [Usnea florida]
MLGIDIDEQHILAVLKRELCPLAMAMARAGDPVQRMSTAIEFWASVPSFSYRWRQHCQKCRQSPSPLLSFPEPKNKSSLYSIFRQHIPIWTKLCPGGTTVLKHHPHRLHLRRAQLTARNELSIPQPLLLPNANGVSAQIIWRTHRASNTKAATGRSYSRTQQICHFPVTVIERPETHPFSLAKGKNRYGDGEGPLAEAGSARVSGDFFRLQSAKVRVIFMLAANLA